MLASRNGAVVPSSLIRAVVWGKSDRYSKNLLKTYIYNLRKKLGKDSIRNSKSYGYITDECIMK